MAQLSPAELAAIRAQVSRRLPSATTRSEDPPVESIALIQDERSADRIRPDALRLAELWARSGTSGIKRSAGVLVELAAAHIDVVEGAALRPAFSQGWHRFLVEGSGRHPILVSVEGPFIEAVSARLLGALDTKPGRVRAPSDVGRSLFSRVGRIICSALRTVGPEALDLEYREVDDPQESEELRRLFLDQDSLLTVTLETKQPAEGRWRLLTRPETFLARPQGLGAVTRPSSSVLEHLLERVPVELSVELGRALLPLSQLQSLAVGALVELDSYVESALPVYCEQVPKALGKPILVNGTVAIEIQSTLTPLGGGANEHGES